MNVTPNFATLLRVVNLPVLTKGGRSRAAPRPSAVQRLCSDFEAAIKNQDAKFAAVSAAEHKAEAARPKVPALIRATKRNVADLDYSSVLMRNKSKHRPPLRSMELASAIARLKANSTKRDDLPGGIMVITVSEKLPFPLSSREKTRLARLEQRLAAAKSYEKKCRAVRARARTEELQSIADATFSIVDRLMTQILKRPSKCLQDVLAKARVCHNKDFCEDKMALSIVDDLNRLSAASLI